MKSAIAYFLLCVGVPQMCGLVFGFIPAVVIRSIKLPIAIARLVWPEFVIIGLFMGAGGALCSWWMFGLFGLNKLLVIPILCSVFYGFYAWSYNKLFSGEWIGQILGFWICWTLL